MCVKTYYFTTASAVPVCAMRPLRMIRCSRQPGRPMIGPDPLAPVCYDNRRHVSESTVTQSFGAQAC